MCAIVGEAVVGVGVGPGGEDGCGVVVCCGGDDEAAGWEGFARGGDEEVEVACEGGDGGCV